MVEQIETFEKTGKFGKLLALLMVKWNETVYKQKEYTTAMGVYHIMREPVKKILAQMFDFYKNNTDGVMK